MQEDCCAICLNALIDDKTFHKEKANYLKTCPGSCLNSKLLFQNTVTLSCGHKFHQHCIYDLINTTSTDSKSKLKFVSLPLIPLPIQNTLQSSMENLKCPVCRSASIELFKFTTYQQFYDLKNVNNPYRLSPGTIVWYYYNLREPGHVESGNIGILLENKQELDSTDLFSIQPIFPDYVNPVLVSSCQVFDISWLITFGIPSREQIKNKLDIPLLTEPINVQNIQCFNDLVYRDTKLEYRLQRILNFLKHNSNVLACKQILQQHLENSLEELKQLDHQGGVIKTLLNESMYKDFKLTLQAAIKNIDMFWDIQILPRMGIYKSFRIMPSLLCDTASLRQFQPTWYMAQTISTKTGWDLETVWILLQYLSVCWIPGISGYEEIIKHIPKYEKLQIHAIQSLTSSSDVEEYYKNEIRKSKPEHAEKLFQQLWGLLHSNRFNNDNMKEYVSNTKLKMIKTPEQTQTWIQSLQHSPVLKKIQSDLSIDLNSKQWHKLSSYDKLLVVDYLSF